jgi:hypothetical protein
MGKGRRASAEKSENEVYPELVTLKSMSRSVSMIGQRSRRLVKCSALAEPRVLGTDAAEDRKEQRSKRC